MVPRHRNADEIAVADDLVGRVEVDPPHPRKVDLHPRMRRASPYGLRRVGVGYEDVAAHEPGGEAQRPGSFDHQEGKIATRPMPALQGVAWRLHAPLDATPVGELFADPH